MIVHRKKKLSLTVNKNQDMQLFKCDLSQLAINLEKCFAFFITDS